MRVIKFIFVFLFVIAVLTFAGWAVGNPGVPGFPSSPMSH
jgi:hypothetical protein